jgi:hypothetical protein
MTVLNFSRIILYSAIIFLVGFQNVAIANQNINFSLSPSNAYVDETTTFTIEFTSSQNLSNLIMHFFVDANEKGAKNLFNIEKNKKYFITFDHYFNKNSHLGEHYIELKIDFITENQEEGSNNFYTVVNVYGHEKRPSAIFETIVLYFFLCLYFIALIGGFIYSKRSKKGIIDFKKEERKFLFKSIVTFLPISISIFALYLTQKPELKIGMLSILLCFITSFFSALYLFIVAENVSDAKADNFTLYSLSFLFLGLVEMVLLVLFF